MLDPRRPLRSSSASRASPTRCSSVAGATARCTELARSASTARSRSRCSPASSTTRRRCASSGSAPRWGASRAIPTSSPSSTRGSRQVSPTSSWSTSLAGRCTTFSCRDRVPWVDVLDYGVKLAGALESSHREGVLHRDVKPENMMLSAWGEPHLGDFGIAAREGRLRDRGRQGHRDARARGARAAGRAVAGARERPLCAGLDDVRAARRRATVLAARRRHDRAPAEADRARRAARPSLAWCSCGRR